MMVSSSRPNRADEASPDAVHPRTLSSFYCRHKVRPVAEAAAGPMQAMFGSEHG